MKIKEFLKIELFKKVLERLYKEYPEFVQIKPLSIAIDRELYNERNGTCLYLEDKGLIMRKNQAWRITAQGIDFLEQRDLLKPEPGGLDFWTVDTKGKS